ncbi:hypothetical protein [uncultured Cloacibacillus sp.]|uniref:hypothetical protein n=1 Tax=uncultured Cloacibacillus sp. TaxID=889794 RepID=UPI003208E1BD
MKNKYIALILALPLAIFLAAAAPRAAEAETAVVDVARVIDASAPGKAGQQYVDNLQKALNEEFERFRKANEKEKDGERKIAQKQAELNAEFFRERDRVTALVMAELRKVVDQWIKSNKKGVTVIVPANVALGFAKSADVSAEILKRLNTVTIDFTKK